MPALSKNKIRRNITETLQKRGVELNVVRSRGSRVGYCENCSKIHNTLHEINDTTSYIYLCLECTQRYV